jgi:predicted GNAT family acetyltransferase
MSKMLDILLESEGHEVASRIYHSIRKDHPDLIHTGYINRGEDHSVSASTHKDEWGPHVHPGDEENPHTGISVTVHPEKKLVKFDSINVKSGDQGRGKASSLVNTVIKATPPNYKFITRDISRGFWANQQSKNPGRWPSNAEEMDRHYKSIK